MGDCYLIYKNNDSGHFPMYRTTEGKIAVMLFKSHDQPFPHAFLRPILCACVEWESVFNGNSKLRNHGGL